MLLGVLGNHPILSLAELQCAYGGCTQHCPQTAVFEGSMWPHLGGSAKLAEVITTLDDTSEETLSRFVLDQLPGLLPLPSTKFSIALSIYGRRLRRYHALVFDLKRRLKAGGLKPRIVTGDTQALSSAQVLHNDLWDGQFEIIISIGTDSIHICRTRWVQDITSYTKRDIERPCRDMKVGMLPPKLAQIMINLTGGEYIFDPFIGTGVIAQEALLMGKRTGGSDISPQVIKCAKRNLDWLEKEFKTAQISSLQAADALSVVLPGGVDAITSEGYLGPILTQNMPRPELDKLAAESDKLLTATLENLAPQLLPGTPLTLAAPCWPHAGAIIAPRLVDSSPPSGYNLRRLNGIAPNLLRYLRPNQFVGRQLVLLEKSP